MSGGGARGLAHIGVLKVLVREGITVDCLAGTSMGGLIAAAYAVGMSPAEIEQQALVMARWRHLVGLADRRLPRRGLLRGDRLLAYFERCLGQCTFAELDVPLALVAVDLDTGQEVVLREGSVARAVRATVAVPGLIAPAEMDGRRLADGGLLNNLPVDVARRLGADIVIAVDVTARQGDVWHNPIRWAPDAVTDTLQVMGESIAIMMSAINESKLEETRPEILIRPQLRPGVNTVSGYTRAAELIGDGERAAEAALPIIPAKGGGAYSQSARRSRS